MEFEIKRVMTAEYSFDFLKIDLNHLQDFIANRVKNVDYGTSVTKYFWGFDLFKFDGGFSEFYKNDIESWKHSLKWLVISTRFDWNVIKALDDNETFELLKVTFLKSIDRFESMKRKPKNFDHITFKRDMEIILNDYKPSL